jgi:hypothetical protein
MGHSNITGGTMKSMVSEEVDETRANLNTIMQRAKEKHGILTESDIKRSIQSSEKDLGLESPEVFSLNSPPLRGRTLSVDQDFLGKNDQKKSLAPQVMPMDYTIGQIDSGLSIKIEKNIPDRLGSVLEVGGLGGSGVIEDFHRHNYDTVEIPGQAGRPPQVRPGGFQVSLLNSEVNTEGGTESQISEKQQRDKDAAQLRAETLKGIRQRREEKKISDEKKSKL